MKVHDEKFEFETGGEFDTVDLTDSVEAAVKASGVQEGIAVVYTGHSTGILVLNEDERGLQADLKDLLRRLVPAEGVYHHPDNAFAHLRQMLFSQSRVITVRGGRIGLGTWQNIYWVETERRRRERLVEVMVIGE